MRRVLQNVILTTLLTATAWIPACGDDDPVDPPCIDCCDICPPIKDLTHREDVLLNIETAYNKRRIDWYNGLLDQNFTFFLSTGDVNNGLPVSWNRADEVNVNMKLFDKNYTALPAQSIFMDIRTEDGLSWIEFHPVSAPSETWYQTTLLYDYKFEISPNTYIPAQGTQAVFTVRDAGKYGKYDHHWQLVEMRDLGAATTGSARTAALIIQATTWGAVKSMYLK